MEMVHYNGGLFFCFQRLLTYFNKWFSFFIAVCNVHQSAGVIYKQVSGVGGYLVFFSQRRAFAFSISMVTLIKLLL